MKLQIQSYLIGVLNNHKRIIGSMKDNGYSKVSIQSHENHTNELRDLYDFISILPDEQIPDTYKEINRLRSLLEIEAYDSEQRTFEIISYKKRIAELEESCENMCEVEKSLHKQIEILKRAYNSKQITCNELKAEIEKLTGPKWVQD